MFLIWSCVNWCGELELECIFVCVIFEELIGDVEFRCM